METKTEKKLSRRDFLKASGAAVVTAAAGAVGAKEALAKSKPTLKKRFAMVIDLRRCFGCHACSVACKAQFDVPLGVWRSWVKYLEKGTYPNVKRYFLPRLCNHCSDAPCVTVCPTKASYIREDGIVMIDEKKCISCKSCRAMCPYNSRFTHPFKKVANKCDFCVERLEQGLEPACVNTCNAKARIFGDINNPESEVSRLIASNPVQQLKPELGTKPQVYYIDADEETMRLYGEEGKS